MIKFNEIIVMEERIYYVVAIKLRPDLTVGRRDEEWLYYHSNRYSPYSGRPQLSHGILDAKRYKTEAGAKKAAESIGRQHNVEAVACRFTCRTTMALETL